MGQDISWRVKEFPTFCENRVQRGQAMGRILRLINQIHYSWPYFSVTLCNIFPTTPRSYKRSIPFKSSEANLRAFVPSLKSDKRSTHPILLIKLHLKLVSVTTENCAHEWIQARLEKFHFYFIRKLSYCWMKYIYRLRRNANKICLTAMLFNSDTKIKIKFIVCLILWPPLWSSGQSS
jgi:hypothetical protein